MWRGVTLILGSAKHRLGSGRAEAWMMCYKQVTRQIVEEATACLADDPVVLIRLFDIDKAYPRVNRDALWMLLQMKGTPSGVLSSLPGAPRAHKVFSPNLWWNFLILRGE